ALTTSDTHPLSLHDALPICLPAPASLSGLPGGLFPTHRPSTLTAAPSGLIVGVSELKLTEQGRLSRHLVPDLGVQGVDYLLPLAACHRHRGLISALLDGCAVVSGGTRLSQPPGLVCPAVDVSHYVVPPVAAWGTDPARGLRGGLGVLVAEGLLRELAGDGLVVACRWKPGVTASVGRGLP